MPTATNTNTTPTRRVALGFSAAATIAGLTAPAIASTALPAGRQETVDPILETYRQYRALEDAHDVVHARYTVLRAGLVERYGECRGMESVADLWERDPTYAEMSHASDESDRITEEELVPVTNSIIETPAATLSGLLAKSQVALDLWPSADADLDLHEDAALAALRDTVRLLASLTRVRPPAEAAPSPDAELIEVCDRLVAIRQAELAVYAVRKTVEAERRTEPALDVLSAETEALMRRIDDIPDTQTLAGLQALSRAARAMAPLRADGTPYFEGGDAEWLALEVTRALAEGIGA
jgi:hypothetical protein